MQHEVMTTFYDKYFPYESMFKWLTHGDKTSFKKREISFTKGDIYSRYKSYDNAELFKQDLVAIVPHKIDLGAIFTLPPPQHKQVEPGTFLPMSKEFVVDIDISDYDNVRFCGCNNAKFCYQCWPLMTCAREVLDSLLLECFGFEHRLWVYSGRRGVHCWVGDESARNLDNESRSAVTEFLHMYIGNDKSNKKLTLSPKFPHPNFDMMSKTFAICEKYFLQIYCDHTDTSESRMYIFESEDKWSKLLSVIDDNDLRKGISDLVSNNSQLRGDEIWYLIKNKYAKDYKGYIPYIVYSFVYPRLDANVSKQLNHLLKSPFCVHPSTEYICVPMKSLDFYPDTHCPKVRDLVEDGKESIRTWAESLKYFEKHVEKLAKKRTQAKIKIEKAERTDKMEVDDF